MEVEVQIIKDLPYKQMNDFEDKVVYNCAVETREISKNIGAFPYLTGELERQEIAAPIVGSNKEYGLSTGVDYASRVYMMGENTNWTNARTQAHWYYAVFSKYPNVITNNAQNKALKEI